MVDSKSKLVNPPGQGLLPRSPKESWVEMTEIVLPQHTNALGTVFGGTVMAWVDTAAAVCAMRHSRMQVVTASIDAMHFLAPIKLGWVVTIKAAVNFVAHSSCEIGIRITSENPITGEHYHTASAYATFVALDMNGKPASMPPLLLETDVERQRFEDGRHRRDERLRRKATLTERRIRKGLEA